MSQQVEPVEVVWNDGGVSKDDFTAETDDGYMLRAEQMDDDDWWWQVYYPDGGEGNPWGDFNANSKHAAKGIAELVYRLHRAQSKP